MTAQWTGQQLRNAFPFEQLPRYLLRDRDAIFGESYFAGTLNEWSPPRSQLLVDIHVELDGDHITLAVRDFGKGMPQELLEELRSKGEGGGVGLNGMRERITQFGGRFEIESSEKDTLI